MIEKINIPVVIEGNLKKLTAEAPTAPIYDSSGRIINEQEYNASRKGKVYTLNNQVYYNIKLEYFELINRYREKMDDEFIGGMPIQLEGSCSKQLLRIKNNQLVYSVTLKVDGERFLMFIDKQSMVYLIDRSTNIFYFETSTPKEFFKANGVPVKFPGLKSTIIDGELVKHADGSFEYLIFDILFYQGKSVMGLSFNDRYLESKKAIDIIHKTVIQEFKCSLKMWFSITEILNSNNLYKRISQLTNKPRKINKLIADGLIFQPNDTSYIPFREWNGYNNVQFKWKPPEKLTVDFKINAISDKKWILLTSTDQPYNISQPQGNPLPATCIPTEEDLKKYRHGEVVEFRYKLRGNPKHNLFTTEKSRNEKKANGYRTIMSTLNAIKENFKIESMVPAFKALTTAPFTKESVSTILDFYSESDLILWSLNFEKEMFFSEQEIENIQEIYDVLVENPKYEFECRLYNFTQPKGKAKSGPIVMNKGVFFYLLDFCYQNFPMQSENTIDVYLNDLSNGKYRSTYRSIQDIYSKRPITNITKTNVKSYVLKPTHPNKKLYNNLNVKFSLSKEQENDQVVGLRSTLPDGKPVQNNIRIKTRKMFKVNDNWRIDFTRIKTSYEISDILEKNEILELEIEFINKSIPPFDEFIKSLNDLYVILLNNSGYC